MWTLEELKRNCQKIKWWSGGTAATGGFRRVPIQRLAPKKTLYHVTDVLNCIVSQSCLFTLGKFACFPHNERVKTSGLSVRLLKHHPKVLSDYWSDTSRQSAYDMLVCRNLPSHCCSLALGVLGLWRRESVACGFEAEIWDLALPTTMLG